ncbi:hypothetical protein ACWC24_33775 [Streptomyces sp. NPDC001443]
MTRKKTTFARRPLPRFEEAEGLGPRDAEFVRDLVAVLERHGNLDRFGLCLLHDHFPLAADEVLVEVNDPETRTLHARVERIGHTGHVKASQWRFVPKTHPLRGADFEGDCCQAIQLCDPLDLCPGREQS